MHEKQKMKDNQKISKKFKVVKFTLNLNDYANNSYYQQNPLLFVQLKSLLDGHTISSIGKILNTSKNQHIVQTILNFTSKLLSDRSISERLYWILHDLHDFPICQNPNCINNCVKLCDIKYFKGFVKGYQKHCCNRCAQFNPETTQTKRDTTQLRHGDPNYRNLEKAKQTFIQNYGVDNPMKSNSFKSNLAKKNLDRFGVEWYVQTDEFKQKSIISLRDHYHEDIINPFQATEVKKQLKTTWNNNYGVDNPTKSQIIKDKVQKSFHDTSIKLYGTYWPIQNPKVFAKMKRKYVYDNVQFDSFPEVAYYIWLKDNNIKFEYQPHIVFTFMYDDIKHTYHPDFLLIDSGIIIDIKPSNAFLNGKMICIYDRSLDEIYEAKHQCMIANNVKIMLEDEYMQYIIYVENKFGKNFKKECRKNKKS